MKPDNLAELAARSAAMAGTLKLMGHPERLLMLCRMEQGEVSVSELVDLAGLSQSAVSQHLALLRLAGVVAVRGSAQTRYYSLCDPTVHAVITALCTLCESNGQAPEPTTRSGESAAP